MDEPVVSGARETVRSTDGVAIGTVTAGAGPPLLLVHGGMRSAAGWAPLWPLLVDRYRVTAMDRRGRGMSGDAPTYAFDQEYEDVAAVARHLGPVDVVAHSIGAVFALGAAVRGAPIRRLVLCEPPGPPTISEAWIERASARMAAGETGRALVEFLVEIIGLDQATMVAMRGTPVAENALDIFTATFRREGELLRALDLADLTRGGTAPVRFLLGDRSPVWAATVTHTLAAALPDSTVTLVAGHGHDFVDSAPDAVLTALEPAIQ
jgi:pimeloyl-ACP methyl ester carboxylesterase